MDFRVLQDYAVLYPVGSGGFAKVYVAIHGATGSKVAIKVINKKENNEDGRSMVRIQREIEIFKKVNNPFIARLFDILETEEEIYLIMEFASNGTLLNYINEHGAFSEENAAIIFAQLMLAVRYLHEDMHVCHRDIKAENVIFDSKRNIRIIDFGLSNQPNEDNVLRSQCGSPSYAAPEMIMGSEYSYGCDIWSCGCVLYALTVGHLPFEDQNMQRLAQKIIYKEVDIPASMGPELTDLVLKMLCKSPEKRPSVAEVLEHPWLMDAVKKASDALSIKSDIEQIKASLRTLGLDSSLALPLIDDEAYLNNYPEDNTRKDGDAVILRILSRCNLNDNLPQFWAPPTRRAMRRSSYHEGEKHLPHLSPNKFLSEKRKSMPIKPNTSAVRVMKRKAPLPIIHIMN